MKIPSPFRYICKICNMCFIKEATFIINLLSGYFEDVKLSRKEKNVFKFFSTSTGVRLSEISQLL